MITKEEFEKLVDIELTEKNGKLVCNGLYLNGRTDVTELPDNLKILGGLSLRNTGVTKLPKGLEVEGLLVISCTNIEELPEDTKIDGGLFVNYMNKPFSFPKVLKVEDCFECKHTTIKRMPEELHVKYSFDFSHSKFDKLPLVMEFGYTLYLHNTNITELPEGLKEVYGNFDISFTKMSKLNDNLVVYRELNLSYTPIKELPKGLIIGYVLGLCGTKLRDYSNLHKVCSSFVVTEDKYNEIKDTLVKHRKKIIRYNEVHVTFEPNYKGAYLFENEIGKFIYADKIFAKIVEQKGNVYHIDIYGDGEITYLITDGEGRWSHGDTLEEAKNDLVYKITDRNKSDYENLSLDSELSFDDAIVCYRVITGACSFGTKDFIKNRLGKNRKDVYTIKEIITLTEGEYGNGVFKGFFVKL